MQNKELAEIQQKYAGCNLLMPASTEVQLNPFYKITVMEVPVDLSENSGDVFKVGAVKAGQQNGRDIYVDTFSPAKPLLMKLAAAAGIQFDPEHTYGTRVDQNTYKARYASSLEVGQHIQMEGRIQSRVYAKRDASDNVEYRTAYELSVSRIALSM